ncbi:MAG TPA: hypothetical protein VLB10_00280 [Gammaproteobacteria bacterium]|jgi:hypothetical protein|nr:hypothetical protein [Gammaproteobacteria bacterium]
MSLFARILSHGFALVVVVLMGLGLVYRGDLFPDMQLPDFLAFERAADSGTSEMTGSVTRGETVSADDGQVAGSAVQPSVADAAGPVQDKLSETADKTAAGSIVAPADEAPASQLEDSTRVPAMMTDDMPAGDAGDVDVDGEADTIVPETPVALPAADEPMVTDTQTRAAPPMPVAAADMPAAEADLAAPATTAVISNEPAGQAGTATDPASAVSEQVGPSTAGKPAESPYRLLAAAREAYWLRDYATAEEKYRALIDLDPTNPDGFGELGNMYFSQGKWELASATYFEAGKRLADEGLFEQANQLVDVLKGLQGTQAQALEKYIAGKSTATQ